MKVFCVFQIRYEDEKSLWRVFDTNEKAEKWIEEHGKWARFEVEPFTVE